jgi:hypothetical protein
MNAPICQSCGMPMDKEELLGTNADGSKNNEYCTYCFQNGAFPDPDVTLEQMIETCVPFLKEEGMEEEAARKHLQETFPKLKRWQ